MCMYAHTSVEILALFAQGPTPHPSSLCFIEQWGSALQAVLPRLPCHLAAYRGHVKRGTGERWEGWRKTPAYFSRCLSALVSISMALAPPGQTDPPGFQLLPGHSSPWALIPAPAPLVEGAKCLLLLLISE